MTDIASCGSCKSAIEWVKLTAMYSAAHDAHRVTNLVGANARRHAAACGGS